MIMDVNMRDQRPTATTDGKDHAVFLLRMEAATHGAGLRLIAYSGAADGSTAVDVTQPQGPDSSYEDAGTGGGESPSPTALTTAQSQLQDVILSINACRAIHVMPAEPNYCEVYISSAGLFASSEQTLKAGSLFEAKVTLYDEFANSIVSPSSSSASASLTYKRVDDAASAHSGLHGETHVDISDAGLLFSNLYFAHAPMEVRLSVHVAYIDAPCTTEALRVIPDDPCCLQVSDAPEETLRAGDEFCVSVGVTDRFGNVVDEEGEDAGRYQFSTLLVMPARSPQLSSLLCRKSWRRLLCQNTHRTSHSFCQR